MVKRGFLLKLRGFRPGLLVQIRRLDVKFSTRRSLNITGLGDGGIGYSIKLDGDLWLAGSSALRDWTLITARGGGGAT